MRATLRTALALTAAAIPVGLAASVAGPADGALARPASAARPAATTYNTAGSLNGVAAASLSSAWAVGFAGSTASRKVLMLHWNGTRWSRVTSPKVLTGPGVLSAISVVSATDGWAVGDTGTTSHPHSLILHWNGTAWSKVTSPAPLANAGLSAVSANSKSGWAVGYHSTSPSVIGTAPLIFELKGTKWSRVDPTFGRGSGVELDGVATTSAKNTFATGLYTGQVTGELARWNGTAWNWDRAFPERGTYHWLNGIAAGPHGVAFAVGFNTATAALGPISIRWTGHAWVKAPAPHPALPYTVAFAPGGTAWAAGSAYSGGSTLTQMLRWNGHAWTGVTSPLRAGALYGLGFATARYGWAVGHTVSGSGSPRTLILHWDGHSWS